MTQVSSKTGNVLTLFFTWRIHVGGRVTVRKPKAPIAVLVPNGIDESSTESVHRLDPWPKNSRFNNAFRFTRARVIDESLDYR